MSDRHYWELIANSLSRAGYTWGIVKVLDPEGATWALDARKDDVARHIVHCDDLLAGFLELEASVKTTGKQ